MTFLAAKPRVWTNLSSSRHSYRNLSPHLGCAENNNPDCQLLRPARFLPCMKFAFVAKSRPAQIPICAMFQFLILEFKAPSHFCWGSNQPAFPAHKRNGAMAVQYWGAGGCRTEAQQVLLQSLRNNCMPTEDNHAEPTRQIQTEPVVNRVCKSSKSPPQHTHTPTLPSHLQVIISICLSMSAFVGNPKVTVTNSFFCRRHHRLLSTVVGRQWYYLLLPNSGPVMACPNFRTYKKNLSFICSVI